MSKISLTTNVDLQNYAVRIDTVAKAFRPLGIEIFSIPQNYLPKTMLELPETEKPFEGKFTILSRQTAKEIGKKMKENGIVKIQFHYPWQKTLLDMDGHDFALTVQFCDIIKDEAKAEQLTINHHNVLKYPIPSVTRTLDGKYREELHKMLETEAKFAQTVKSQFNSRCKLIVENNPAISIDKDNKTGEGIVDNFDLVAEDYINRSGIEGTNFDESHAEGVIGYFAQNDKTYDNLEWCRRQYSGVPKSAHSLDDFVHMIAPKIYWVHLSDEPRFDDHKGSHIGEGKIDFKRCAEILNSYLDHEVPATIEVKDGHVDAGFRKIIDHDLPYLKKFFE